MKTNLVIAEDNLDCSRNIYNMIKTKNINVEVVGITANGVETIKLVKEINPDILILDLKMPIKNGLYVLEEIKEKKNINIIITSGEIQMINKVNISNYNSIKNIFIKPFDYELLCCSINKLCKNSKEQSNKNMINDILHNFEFNFSSLFYEYLLETIDKMCFSNVTLQCVFKEISIDSNMNYNRIKWGIEKLIKSMIRFTPEEKIKKFFPYTNRPSTKVFIKAIADVVNEKCK